VTVASRLLTRINEYTVRLDELRRLGVSDWRDEMALLHLLQVQAQAFLDLLMHLAAEAGYSPSSPGEAAAALEAEGLLDRGELEFTRKVVGFRNVVVHEYAGVDLGLALRILGGREYARVAVLAASLVERARARGLDP